MVKLWSSLLVLVVAVLVAASSASAAEKKGQRKRKSVDEMAKMIFDKLDTKDPKGSLSLEEFTASRRNKDKKAEDVKKAYDEIDANKEGGITLDEFKAWMKKRMEERRKEGGSKRRKKEKKAE